MLKHPVRNCELYTLAKGVFIFKEIKHICPLLLAVMFKGFWAEWRRLHLYHGLSLPSGSSQGVLQSWTSTNKQKNLFFCNVIPWRKSYYIQCFYCSGFHLLSLLRDEMREDVGGLSPQLKHFLGKKKQPCHLYNKPVWTIRFPPG